MNRFFGGVTSSGFNPYVRPTGATTATTWMPNYIAPTPTPVQNYPQPQQTVIPNQTNIIWVDNAEQIATYPTGRGWQQWFGDKNEQILYVRDTDANGVTQPIVKLRYEVMEVPSKTQTEEPVQQISNGPTREEFDKLSDSVNMLVDKLGDLLK